MVVVLVCYKLKYDCYILLLTTQSRGLASIGEISKEVDDSLAICITNKKTCDN